MLKYFCVGTYPYINIKILFTPGGGQPCRAARPPA